MDNVSELLLVWKFNSVGAYNSSPEYNWIESIASNMSTCIVHNGLYVAKHEGRYGKCNLFDCAAQYISSLLLPIIVPSSAHTNVVFRTHAIDKFATATCTEMCKLVDSQLRLRNNKVLVVLTTCNHIAATLEALGTLRENTDSFDLVIIDDFSVDGTTEILIKQGYFVIQKLKGMGLTDSWNIGYRLARSMGYTHLILSNNDVHVPSGAIAGMVDSLQFQEYPVIVPLTTRHACGHNPIQSIKNAHNMTNAMALYAFSRANFQLVQQGLTKFRSNDARRNLILSSWKGKIRFNGFFFGVNVEHIYSASVDEKNLFDPDATMVFQEDKLTTRMFALNGQRPAVDVFSFVFHEKSVTVKAAHYISGSSNETRNDISLYHPEMQVASTASYRSLTYPNLYSLYPVLAPHRVIEFYPPLDESVVRIALVVDEHYDSLRYGKALALALSNSHVVVQARVTRGADSNGFDYQLRNVDVLLVLSPAFNLGKASGISPTLRVVLWIDSSISPLSEWLGLLWLGNVDLILVAARMDMNIVRGFDDFPVSCFVRCPVGIQNMITSRRSVPVGYLYKDNISASLNLAMQETAKKLITLLEDTLYITFPLLEKDDGAIGNIDGQAEASSLESLPPLICMTLRLTHDMVPNLEAQITTLFKNAMAAAAAGREARGLVEIGLRLFVINMEAVSPSLTAYMSRLVDFVNLVYGRPQLRVHLVLTDDLLFGHRVRSMFTVHEVMDHILSHMTEARSGCEWLLFRDSIEQTLFTKSWFAAVAQELSLADFHNAYTIRWSEQRNRDVSMRPQANYTEWVQTMGHRLVRTSLFHQRPQIAFLPHGMFTRMIFSREYLMNVAIDDALLEMGVADRVVKY